MGHLEIACFNEESVRVAVDSGADRIEFCAGLDVGGTTPDPDVLARVKAGVSVPIFVMIRPRGGDFIYTPDDFDQMRTDIKSFKPIADGFVFGILLPDGRIDVERNTELVQLTSLPCTFHRAFDETDNHDAALEDVIACGFQNILSSGGSGNAVANVGALTELVRKASGRITIIPGGGIRSNTIEPLLHTTAVWYHSSAILDGELCDGDEVGRLRVLLG